MRLQSEREPSSAPQPSQGWQGRLKLGLGLAISSAILAVIASRIDIDRVRASLAHVPLGALVGAVLLIGAGFAAKIARWHLMLTSITPQLPGAVSAQTLLASIALNNVLPLRAGDVARVFGFNAATGVQPSAVLPLMVLERLLDTAMLVVMAAAVAIPLTSLGVLPVQLKFIAPIAALVVISMLGLAIIAGPLAAFLANHPERGIARLPLKLRRPALEAATVLANQLKGRHAVLLLGLTVIAWVCEGGMLAVLAAGFGFQMPIVVGYLACALATLATLIPSAPGFVGTYHAAAIAGVSVFGSPTDDAAAFAFLAHGLLWLPLTICGLGCLALLTRAKRTLKVMPS